MSLSRKSLKNSVFIEQQVPGRHPKSPFMGKRRSVALLKELPYLNSVRCSINISLLRGSFDQLLMQAFFRSISERFSSRLGVVS